MTGGRRGPSRPVGAILLIVAVILSACSSTVTGTGSTGAPTASGSRGSRTAASPSRTSSTPTTVPYPRTPVVTGLGDPLTADLCRAVGLPAMSTFGYQPEFSDIIVPPSCQVRMIKNGARLFTVRAFGYYPGQTSTAPGRVARNLAGLTTYFYPYSASTMNCERDLVLTGAVLRITVQTNPSAGKASPTDLCRGSTTMVARLAAQAANGAAAFPRLPVADPSTNRFDFCSVLQAVDLDALTAFAGGTIHDDGFATQCSIDKGNFFLDVGQGTAGAPPGTHLQTVGGHKLYLGDDQSEFCDWYSVQGTTPDGEQSERIAAETSGRTPANLCAQTGYLLAAILDKAGLK